MLDKFKTRQDKARERLLKDLENRRQNLQFKLKVAQERKEHKIYDVQQRANTQNQRFEETNFMNKLTK